MTPEDRAIQRFTLERQRRAAKSSLFDLNDDDEGDGSTTLTHYGQSLGDVRQPLQDQEDFFKRSKTVDEGATALPPKKRTKAEIMQEVMAKSKAYKVCSSIYCAK